MTKINRKIVATSVVSPEDPRPVLPVNPRPETLPGTTYKVKTPLSDAALYVTINDCDGRPFEIFVNSKAMEHFQWTVAVTRLVSMVFRQRGDLGVLCEELRSIADPKGGYFKKGGRFMPSLVAEIGDVIESHCVGLGLIERDDSLAEAARAMVAEKAAGAVGQTCAKCGDAAVVVMDGCLTCTSCGESKCN